MTSLDNSWTAEWADFFLSKRLLPAIQAVRSLRAALSKAPPPPQGPGVVRRLSITPRLQM